MFKADLSEKVNWEHHGELTNICWLLSLTDAGPGSWVSICSQPGLRWVSERAGNTDFAQSAKSLTLGWSRRLKFLSPLTRSEQPEPDEEKAWEYCTGKLDPSL